MSETENEETTTTEETAAEETPAAEVEETPAAETIEAAPETAAPAAAAPQAAAEPAAPVRQSGPKPKRKHVPRAERPKKTRPKREVAATRKPITRLPKEEGERGGRQERRGIVVSDAMDKTIVVKVESIRSHPKYKKVIRRSAKFHAHDEQNSAHIGDVVRIIETRPLSKTKNWRLAEIVEVAK